MNKYRDEFELLAAEQHLHAAYELLMQHQADDSYDPFFYNNICWTLNQLERYNEVFYYATKGLNLFPQEGFLYAQLGYSYFRTNLEKQALEFYQKAIELGFDQVWVLADVGNIIQNMCQYKEALEFYESALIEEPQHIFSMIGAAECYYRLNNFDLAIEYYRRLYDLEQDDTFLIDLVTIMIEAKRYVDIFNILDLIENPDHTHWKLKQRAYALYKLTKYEEALEYYKEALNIQPDIDVYMGLSLVYFGIKQFDKADEYAKEAISLLEAAMVLAKDQEKLGFFEKIMLMASNLLDKEEYYRYACQARTVGFSDRDVWVLFIDYYYSTGQYEHAQKYCELFYENCSHDKPFLYYYAIILRKLKQYGMSITIINEYMQLYGDEVLVYSELMMNQIALKQYSNALGTVEKLIDFDDTCWKYHYYKATLCFYLERSEEALELIDLVLTLTIPEDYLFYVYESKAMILEGLSRYDDAAILYENANTYKNKCTDDDFFVSLNM